MNVGSKLFLNTRKFIKKENKSYLSQKKRTKPTEIKLSTNYYTW